MDDAIFNIDPDGLDEKGKEILNEARIIEEALEEINNAKKLLEGWNSPNKEKFENKVNETLPKMSEMTEALSMYGKVATEAAVKVKNTEARVANEIDNDFLG